LYSHQKLERGTAISCNGHWMTFSMKDLILWGWNQLIDKLDYTTPVRRRGMKVKNLTHYTFWKVLLNNQILKVLCI
jgi:hypothetical protein